MRLRHIHAPKGDQERKSAREPLENLRAYDALMVRNALEHGLMDISADKRMERKVTPCDLYRVRLCEGVAEKKLIDFIGSVRNSGDQCKPCDGIMAFRQAERAGLIHMDYIATIPFLPRNPWGQF
ncbi:MAG: hypothetical protein V1827_01090 [Candidatus Micrarchaeota archaeon]